MILPESPVNWLIGTSLHISIIIAVFLPLRPLLRRLIGNQWLCLLWLVILLRLLLPWPLESRFGLLNEARSHPSPVSKSWTIKVAAGEISGQTNNSVSTPARTASGAVTSTNFRWDMAAILYLAGATLSLGTLMWRLAQARRLARKTQPATDERLLSIFTSIPQKWRRNIALRMTECVSVPSISGILRPQIWMPQDWLAQFTDEELHGILLHELGHARRGDLLVQWLFAGAQCVHWFNPLMWIAVRAARFDREMACDAWVLARTGVGGNTAYGSALVKAVRLLNLPLRSSPGVVAMASGRKSFQIRISGLCAFRPFPAWRGAAGIAVMFAALAAATTSRITATEPSAPANSPVAAASTASLDSQPTPASVYSLIKVESKFVEITEAAWKKLSSENTDFQKLNPKLPQLAGEAPSYAALQDQLTDLVKGAWEVSNPSEGINQIALLSRDETDKTMSRFAKSDGVDLLSAPSVTTKSGQRAVIEIIREFRYPSAFVPDAKSPASFVPSEFVTKDIGVTLKVEPRWTKDGSIEMRLNPVLATFLGFLQEKNSRKSLMINPYPIGAGEFVRPVFSTSTGKAAVTIFPGQTVLLGGVRLDCKSTGKDGGVDPGRNILPETVRHVLLIFVTANPAASSDAASPTPAPSPSPVKKIARSEFPYAVPIPNKEGFVTSPYAPDSGAVDVRGFPKETEVKDPYTGKIFLVP